MIQDSSFPANSILSALPKVEYQRLEPYLTSITLVAGTVLYEAKEKIETVYFPDTAIISLVATLNNGTTTEVGLVGGTGILGLPVIFDHGHSNNRAIVQLPGRTIKLSAQVLKREFERGEKLAKLLLSYAQRRIDEVSQLAVCNRHHSIEERLARWLLTVQDLALSKELLLTQEFISNMLGVRRSSVTVTAGIFQKAGLISYSRGKITILDREALEEVTCECYQLFHSNFCRPYLQI